MLEVRDLPVEAREQGTGTKGIGTRDSRLEARAQEADNFQAMETPLVMSGFSPEAIRLWQQQMAGTGLEMVTAGGVSGSAGLAQEPPLTPLRPPRLR